MVSGNVWNSSKASSPSAAANTGDTFLGQDSLHDVADDNLIVNYKDDNLLAGRGHGKNE